MLITTINPNALALEASQTLIKIINLYIFYAGRFSSHHLL